MFKQQSMVCFYCFSIILSLFFVVGCCYAVVQIFPSTVSTTIKMTMTMTITMTITMTMTMAFAHSTNGKTHLCLMANLCHRVCALMANLCHRVCAQTRNNKQQTTITNNKQQTTSNNNQQPTITNKQ